MYITYYVSKNISLYFTSLYRYTSEWVGCEAQWGKGVTGDA